MTVSSTTNITYFR